MRIAVAALGTVVAAAALGACGDNGAPIEADAAPIASGPCGADQLFVGELLDWDSSVVDFHSIGSAVWTVDGMPDRTVTTTPHGAIEMCVPSADVVTFHVDEPTRYIDGPAVLTRAALEFGTDSLLSLRALTPARATEFFAEHGLVYDPTRAEILVYSAGGRGHVHLDRAHDAPIAGNGEGAFYTWASGAVGRYVLFPNVDMSDATATLTLPDKSQLVVPIAPGEITIAGVYY